MQISDEKATPRDFKTRVLQYRLLLIRFASRYGPAVFTLIGAALIGWQVANSVSTYPKGGWEIHFIQSGIRLDLHFHHWYYGFPLYVIALLLIEWHDLASIFLFGLGQTLAAHSFVHEGGIPSLIEGGETWRLSPEIYFPIATALALLYAFFLLRRVEWLNRAREREEIAASYFYPKARSKDVWERLDNWASKYLTHQRRHRDPETNIEYGEWRAFDKTAEWQLHYVSSPFDDELHLLVIRIEHIPLQGRLGKLDDWIRELDAALRPLAQPAVGGPQAAIRAFAAMAQ